MSQTIGGMKLQLLRTELMYLRDDEAILCNTMLSLRSYESFHTDKKTRKFHHQCSDISCAKVYEEIYML